MSSFRDVIFRDRNKLSPYHIPKKLPHRDQQLKTLCSIYGEMIKNIENVHPRFIQIVGNTGTGKTSTTLRFGELIAEKAKEAKIDLRHIHMNCKVDGVTRFVLFGNLARKVAPQLSTKSLSPEEIIRQIIDYLREQKKFLLVSFDEIDYFVQMNPKEHVIYDLTRIPEMYPNEPTPIIGEIFISRSLKWHDFLEPGEKSTLGMGIIEFPKYTSSQVRDILEERVKEAFQPNALEDDALDLVSDITADSPVNGDIRVGLELLYYSGTLAENIGSSWVLPDHVRIVFGEIHPTITAEDIASLDEQGRLVLLALVRSLKAKKSAYVGLSDIRRTYKALCEETMVKPVEDIEKCVQDLIHRNIIEMKSLTELGISGASTIDLERFLNTLAQQRGQNDE